MKAGFPGQLVSQAPSLGAVGQTFCQPLQTQQHRLLVHHWQSWADFFQGFRLKLDIWASLALCRLLSLYLAQGLRQLCRCYFCTILTNCLRCWCFPEPGVLSDCSAVSLWFLLLLLQLRQTTHLGLSINPSQCSWWELQLPGGSSLQFLRRGS